MAFCSTCGKPAPCGVNHKKGKPTSRSRAFALSRAGSSTQPRQLKAPTIAKIVSDWYLHGPNQSVKTFPGSTTATLNISVSAVARGRYYGFRIKDHVNALANMNLNLYGIVLRFCSDHSAGTMGVMKNWSTQNPTAPNPLNRRRFQKSLSTGVQLIAPTGCLIDELPDDLWVVFHFEVEFDAGTVLWTRDSYIQHSIAPRVQIPSDVLVSEKNAVQTE